MYIVSLSSILFLALCFHPLTDLRAEETEIAMNSDHPEDCNSPQCTCDSHCQCSDHCPCKCIEPTSINTQTNPAK